MQGGKIVELLTEQKKLMEASLAETKAFIERQTNTMAEIDRDLASKLQSFQSILEKRLKEIKEQNEKNNTESQEITKGIADESRIEREDAKKEGRVGNSYSLTMALLVLGGFGIATAAGANPIYLFYAASLTTVHVVLQEKFGKANYKKINNAYRKSFGRLFGWCSNGIKARCKSKPGADEVASLNQSEREPAVCPAVNIAIQDPEAGAVKQRASAREENSSAIQKLLQSSLSSHSNKMDERAPASLALKLQDRTDAVSGSPVVPIPGQTDAAQTSEGSSGSDKISLASQSLTSASASGTAGRNRADSHASHESAPPMVVTPTKEPVFISSHAKRVNVSLGTAKNGKSKAVNAANAVAAPARTLTTPAGQASVRRQSQSTSQSVAGRKFV